MKRRWLRGLLLGVSVALLLGSGVALAQGLFLTREKDCVRCAVGAAAPSEDQLQRFTLGGWTTRYPLCLRSTIDGVLHADACWLGYPPTDPYTTEGEPYPCYWGALPVSLLGLGEEISVSNGAPSPLGVWVLRLYQRNDLGVEIDWAQTSFLVAEVCEEEFVPEPGTMVLLGSGLVGLAGYATLRWRSRE